VGTAEQRNLTKRAPHAAANIQDLRAWMDTTIARMRCARVWIPSAPARLQPAAVLLCKLRPAPGPLADDCRASCDTTALV